MRIIEGAESFLLEGKNNKAVLLLHGYTGAPSEMRPLGDYLHALGYTVSCVRLPGHGTSIKTWRQPPRRIGMLLLKRNAWSCWRALTAFMWQACRWADCWLSSWQQSCR